MAHLRLLGAAATATTLLVLGVPLSNAQNNAQNTATTITFWSTENQPARIARTREIIAQFRKANPDIAVELVGIEEKDLPKQIAAANLAKKLPDVVFHPIDFTVGWAKSGILDVASNDQVVRELGASTFARGPLRMVTLGGKVAAVPSDGWAQLLLYRKDLFEQKGLKVPNTWDAILTAAKALHNPPNQYGFVVPTDPSYPYFQQVFEHLALSNGAKLTNTLGKVVLEDKSMRDTVEFYKELNRFSPNGNIYWQQSRELYFSGKAAMIMWSPFILDELAGLRNDAPVPADQGKTQGWLARNTGFVPLLQGPNARIGSSYGQTQYLGITKAANVPAAKRFVKYWLNEGYLSWLSVAPEGKFPLRLGSKPGSRNFIDGWSKLPVGVDKKSPLSEFYPQSVIFSILGGLNDLNRWGFKEDQGVLVGDIYTSLVIPKVLRQYLDGNIRLDDAVKQIQTQVSALKR
jgi:multiple sugar transport system substrate-binding protein